MDNQQARQHPVSQLLKPIRGKGGNKRSVLKDEGALETAEAGEGKGCRVGEGGSCRAAP